jgi:hypothetical protein
MPSHKMTTHAHALYAAQMDRDDPFLGARMASHAQTGVGPMHDFSRTRRQPAPIEDRFRLIWGRS